MCAQQSAAALEGLYIQKGGRWLRLDASGRLQGERRRPRFFYLRRDQLKEVPSRRALRRLATDRCIGPPLHSIRRDARHCRCCARRRQNSGRKRSLTTPPLLARPVEPSERPASRPTETDALRRPLVPSNAVASPSHTNQAPLAPAFPTISSDLRPNSKPKQAPSTSSDDSENYEKQPRQRLSKPTKSWTKENQQSLKNIPSDDSGNNDERTRQRQKSPILPKPRTSRTKLNLQRSVKNSPTKSSKPSGRKRSVSQPSNDSETNDNQPKQPSLQSPEHPKPGPSRTKENLRKTSNKQPSRKLSVSSGSFTDDSLIKSKKLPRPASFRADEIVRIPSRNVSKRSGLRKRVKRDSSSSGDEFVETSRKPTKRSGRLRKSTSEETLDLLNSIPRLKTTRGAVKVRNGGKSNEVEETASKTLRSGQIVGRKTEKYDVDASSDESEIVAAKRTASLSSWEDGRPTGTSSPRRQPRVCLRRLQFITKTSAAGQRVRIRINSDAPPSESSQSGPDSSQSGSDKENRMRERDSSSSGSKSERDKRSRAAKNAGRGSGDGDASRKPAKTISSHPRHSQFPPPHPRAFTPLEDRLIVDYIQKEGLAKEVNGNTLWKRLETEWKGLGGPQRTWQSLRNRYLRYLLPSLHELALSPRQAQKLRAAAATGSLKLTRKRRNSLLVDNKGPQGAWTRRPRPPLDTTPQSVSEPKPVVTRSGGRRGLLPLSRL